MLATNFIFQLLTSQNPMFFQPDIRISTQKFSLNQYLESHDNGTVYKKQLIQRNMDGYKDAIVKWNKKTKLTKSITGKCAESNLKICRKLRKRL